MPKYYLLFHSPSDDHIGFDDFFSLIQVGAGLLHVEADRVNLVARRFRQAFPGNVAGVGLAVDSEGRLGNDPRITRPLGDADRLFGRIVFVENASRPFFIRSPSDHDMGMR